MYRVENEHRGSSQEYKYYFFTGFKFLNKILAFHQLNICITEIKCLVW